MCVVAVSLDNISGVVIINFLTDVINSAESDFSTISFLIKCVFLVFVKETVKKLTQQYVIQPIYIICLLFPKHCV